MGQKLQAVVDKATGLYPEQDLAGKTLLIAIFGKEPFARVNKGGIENINSWDDVLFYHGITQSEFDDMTVNFDDDDLANKKMKLITAAINDGPLGRNDRWYFPAFNRVAGFGFTGARYGFWGTGTSVGERRSFRTSEGAMHAGRTFTEIYKPFMLIINEEK